MIGVTLHPQGAVVSVRAQPGAKKNIVLGERNGALRIAVTAAPERGKANDAIVEVLAEALHCRRSQITLLSGQTSRDKTFLVEGLSPDALTKCLNEP